MYIHNATFMIEARKGVEFLEWFAPLARKACKLPVRTDGKEGEEGEEEFIGHLSVLKEAQGHEPGSGEPLSVAFQVEFEDMSRLHEWREKRLRPLISAFERRFAPEAMVFTSVFESIF